jgi:hypothetical protein
MSNYADWAENVKVLEGGEKSQHFNLILPPTPQHFPDNRKQGDFYTYILSRSSNKHCSKFDAKKHEKTRWRTAVLSEVAEAYNVPFLKNAEQPFISKWNAHLERRINKKNLDCTHYCSNLSVWKQPIMLVVTEMNLMLSKSTVIIDH